MPKQGKTPKKKSKEKTPQKSGESEYPAMDQEELNRLVQNAIEQSQAQLQQKHEEQIKRLEADREALEERLTRKFEDEVRELNRAFEESRCMHLESKYSVSGPESVPVCPEPPPARPQAGPARPSLVLSRVQSS